MAFRSGRGAARRGLARGLCADDHRSRSAAIRLAFERFLNPERVSMPDFDIDFCQDRRDEVIRYVRERYGHDRVAQIITFGKLSGARRDARCRPRA